jgi:hypothetical protein
MTKLHELAQRLPEKAVLSREESTSVKGGKRYRTTSYNSYRQVKNILQSQGYATQTMVHGNEYCLEW